MTQDPILADEQASDSEGTVEAQSEAEIERLTLLHAERLKEVETDRWRMGERIEALEAQNAELQADFLEQTRALAKELSEARRDLSAEQRARLEDTLAAGREGVERVEAVRREMLQEVKQQEARGERLLGELVASKDASLALVRDHQQYASQQHVETLRHLSQLRSELQTELTAVREQALTAAQLTLKAKDELIAQQQEHAAQLATQFQVLRELEREHHRELHRRDEQAHSRLEQLRTGLGAEIAKLRLRLLELGSLEKGKGELLGELETAAAALAENQARLSETSRSYEQLQARSAELEGDLLAARSEVNSLQAEREQLSQEFATRPLPSAAQQPATSEPATDAELRRLRQLLPTLEREATQYRQAVATLESKVDKTKETLSFRLGYALIHAPKSWEAMKRLPAELLELRSEAKRRRETRRGGVTRTLAVPPATRLIDETMRRFRAEGADAAARFVADSTHDDHERAGALTHLAKALKTSDPASARRVAERAYQLEPLPYRAKWLAFVQYECGELSGPADLLRRLPTNFALRPSEKARIAEIQGLARLQSSLPRVPSVSAPEFEPIRGSTLYVAASALPFHVSGYTVRTHALVRALQDAGVAITATLRPGYPADRGIDLPQAPAEHVFDGVTYVTLPSPHLRRIGLHQFLEAACDALVQHARRVRPELIHAASNHVNALPALLAARKLGLPFIYEVRGQWELTAATRNVDWESTERFALERDLETLVARNADHVLTLTEQLALDFEGRGVARERLTVIPNAVDPAQFSPRKKDPEALLRLGLTASAFTLVYAGSLLHYEGLDDLLRAVALMVEQGIDVSLVIAGDGEAAESLERLRQELRLERRVKLVGRIAPSEIPSLWSVADAAAFPRKQFRVCELVSPLKPLEPMVMGIPVVVSDVAALREMVKGGEIGLLHRAGDAASLAGKLGELARDPILRQQLGRRARETVLAERTWEAAAERVVDVYRRVLASGMVAVVPLPVGRSSMSAEEKALFEERLDQALAGGGTAAVRDLAVRQAGGRSERLLAFCLLKAAGCCQRSNEPDAALDLARAALQTDGNAGILRGVARVFYACSDYAAAADAVSRLERLSGGLVGKDEEFAREVRARTRLLSLLAEPMGTAQQPATPGKSVYFLHFSLPYTSVGYATRSHGLIAGIQAAGYDVRPYTRPGFPHDFKPELEAATLPEVDHVDGIDYRRLLDGSRRGNSESEYLLSSIDAYERVLRAERPELVHAASNYVTALPALLAARRLGLPFIYEIRGFWEITRSSRDSEFENSARFAMMRQFEGLVARAADHVFTLTSAMKAELIQRGVRPERISLVHNGVDPQRFLPCEPHQHLASRLGLSRSVPVIGYVGSFVDYEGLDDLLRACGLLSRRNIDFRLLLVGDGAVMNELQRLVQDEGLEQRAILTGRVPHDEVGAYYSLVDICPFPRKPWEVCEMVSPLKPFEAMAMQKAVVVSSTHALGEIVSDGQNGLVFQKGSVDSLADCLERLVKDLALRQRLERQGRDWVLEHRTWQAAGRVVVAGYRDVLDASKAVGRSRVPA
jgi:glycosyltransferase involved in cell wall biosynthesis